MYDITKLELECVSQRLLEQGIVFNAKDEVVYCHIISSLTIEPVYSSRLM